MISTHSRTSRLRSSRQGFSLIEVAIALVIFVIGALAIIRIFPGALSVIGNNGNQQIATNLNRTVAARLKANGAVPDATFNVKINTTTNAIQWTTTSANHSVDYADVAAAVDGIPRLNNSVPTPNELSIGANSSALTRFRAIQGESAPVVDIGGSPYALTQFPISIQETAGVQTPLAPTVSQDFVLQNVRINRTGDLDFSGATDKDDNSIALTPFAVKAGSLIYVSYRYWDNKTTATERRLWGITDEPVAVTADIPNLAVVTTLKVSPTTVATRGESLPYNAADAQPEKTGVEPQLIEVRVRNFLGAASFNGATDFDRVADARRGMVQVPAGTQGQVALDYIADWSLLLQDAAPGVASSTTPGARQVTLGTTFIEDQAPVGIYSVLFDPSVPATPYRSAFGTDSAASTPLPANRLLVPTEDELRAGKVTFQVTGDQPARARVAYRTRDNWVQQLSVAAKSYKAFGSGRPTGGNPIEQWRDYYLGDDNYIYFHAGEAGKTISLSCTVKETGGERPITARPFVIDPLIIPRPSNVPASFDDSGQIARLKLTDFAGDTLAVADLVSIQALTGTSVTVRTAYVNGTKYAQQLNTITRGAN